MKINIIVSLSLLITCLAFSGQSFSHWGDFGKFGDYKPTCMHSGAKATDFAYATLSFRHHKGTTTRYMLAYSSSNHALKPQIVYTNHKLKKDNPYFPFISVWHRSHVGPNQKYDMGWKTTEPGDMYTCRISDPYNGH